jgi:hypothetical protein
MENQIKWTEKPVQSNLISKIGATVLLLLLVGGTFAIPSLFMLIFMHHSFMMQFYICENVVIFLQRVDLWAKRFNESLKDGRGVVWFFNFMRPIARKTADQLVELSREVKPPVDIKDLSTEEEKYEDYKLSVETAVGQGDLKKLERFSKNENIMKYDDLAKLINKTLPKEEKAKEKVERKYF